LPILYLHPEFDGYLTRHDRAAADQLNPDVLSAPEAPPTFEEPVSPAPEPPEETAPPAPAIAASPVTVLPPEGDVETSPPPPEIPIVTGATTTLLSQLNGSDFP